MAQMIPRMEEELKSGEMDLGMKESGEMTWQMEKED
jgi:hypothetical protein